VGLLFALNETLAEIFLSLSVLYVMTRCLMIIYPALEFSVYAVYRISFLYKHVIRVCSDIYFYSTLYLDPVLKVSIFIFINLYRNIPFLYAYSPAMTYSLIFILCIMVLNIHNIIKTIAMLDKINLAIFFMLFILVVLLPIAILYQLSTHIILDMGNYIVYMNNSSSGGAEGSGGSGGPGGSEGPGGSGGHSVTLNTKNPDSGDNPESTSQSRSMEKPKEISLDELKRNIASYERMRDTA
jgi:uncharacterized membrane protein YgcG